ncbi:hypothetical protein Leryth_026635 [Lithospermum erythrorhizon]|nr:hypothetical protein Leryth_026635 [Lithospermum erythrorhizon]
MKIYQKVAILVLLLVAIASNEIKKSNAQSICNISAFGLMACRPAVTPPNPAPPSNTCCSALAHADISCLCSFRNSALLPTLGIDPRLALLLPVMCNLASAPPTC